MQQMQRSDNLEPQPDLPGERCWRDGRNISSPYVTHEGVMDYGTFGKEDDPEDPQSLAVRLLAAVDRRKTVQTRRPAPECTTEAAPVQCRGLRLTIFSDAFLKQVELARGRSPKFSAVLHTPAGYVLQAAVFILMVAMLGLTPVIKEAALWNDTLGRKVQDFTPQTPYVAHFAISVVIANICAYLRYGNVGLKDCWDATSIIFVSRVSVFYAIGESMEMFTLLYVDGTTWKIINQVKLPLTALLTYFILGRKQTLTQYTLILSVTISVVTYCLLLNSRLGSKTSASTFGITLATVNVAVITIAGIIADHTYKQVKYPFVVLLAQGRVSACIFTSFMMIVFETYNGRFHGFFYGWRLKTYLLTFWLLGKDWAVTFVLRNLDASWKAIGTALGLCITYVVSNILLKWNVDVQLLMLVVAVVINVVGYALVKRDQFVYQRRTEELQRKLNNCDDT